MTIIKKGILILSGLFLFTSNASASIYLLAEGGISDHHISKDEILESDHGIVGADFVASHKDKDQFSYRVAVGYDLTSLVAFELGYSDINETEFKIKESGVRNPGTHPVTAERDVIDLVARVNMPLLFDIYGVAKGGIAMVDQDLHNPENIPIKSDFDSNAVRPTLSLGVDMPFLPFISTQATWTRIFSGGDLHDSIDFISVGVTVHLGL